MQEVTRRQLLELARRAARSAYCPYSRFRVGAALWGEDGFLVTGANVENASYGLTICAERAAIFAAASAGMRSLRAIAVACVDSPAEAPESARMPCGACRQVIAEFAGPETEILIDGVGTRSMEEVLPGAFVLGRDRSVLRPETWRVAVQGERPPYWPERYTGEGAGRLFAVVTPDSAEAERYALAGVHAIVWGNEEGAFTHACADWLNVWTLLDVLSQAPNE
jgi:cytidine deaminase